MQDLLAQKNIGLLFDHFEKTKNKNKCTNTYGGFDFRHFRLENFSNCGLSATQTGQSYEENWVATCYLIEKQK